MVNVRRKHLSGLIVDTAESNLTKENALHCQLKHLAMGKCEVLDAANLSDSSPLLGGAEWQNTAFNIRDNSVFDGVQFHSTSKVVGDVGFAFHVDISKVVSEAALHVTLLDKFRHPALASALFIDSLQFVYTPTPTLDS